MNKKIIFMSLLLSNVQLMRCLPFFNGFTNDHNIIKLSETNGYFYNEYDDCLMMATVEGKGVIFDRATDEEVKFIHEFEKNNMEKTK